MTFEEWWEKVEKYYTGPYQWSHRVIAYEAWEAAYKEGVAEGVITSVVSVQQK